MILSWTWIDLTAAVTLAAILWRLWWLTGRWARWDTRYDALMRERLYRELFTDWNEENLLPGERLVDGERHLKAVK